MKRIISSLFCLAAIVSVLNAQTYYYKMYSYTNGSSTSTNVTGGQFITFQGIMCLETDIKGNPCGNGTLQRTAQNKNMYVGNSYWGAKTKFVFNNDRSSLEVTTSAGEKYTYKRSNAPEGVTTSSLIKGVGSSYGIGVSTAGASPIKSAGSSSSSSSTYKKKEHPKKCPRCLGNGICSKCSGTGKYNTLHSGYTPCPSCDGRGKCTMCHGKGTYGSEWY
jgi:hypothetical protein